MSDFEIGVCLVFTFAAILIGIFTYMEKSIHDVIQENYERSRKGE
mgnify:CR=1 FL=1